MFINICESSQVIANDEEEANGVDEIPDEGKTVGNFSQTAKPIKKQKPKKQPPSYLRQTAASKKRTSVTPTREKNGVNRDKSPTN